MSKIKEIVEQLSNLTIMQAIDLADELERKWGVDSSNFISASDKNLTNTKNEKKEEKTKFNVILASIGKERMKVIKAVKEITGLGLIEAKNKVDSLTSNPFTLKEGLDKESSNKIKEKLTAVGATVDIN
jgi:large subunit ribosomal protein L7/L12